MKRIAAILLTLTAFFALSSAAQAEGTGDINFGVTVAAGTDCMEVEVSGDNAAAMAALTSSGYQMEISVPCSYSGAEVYFGEKKMDSKLSGGKLTFRPDGAGTYEIRKVGQPANPTNPTEPVKPTEPVNSTEPPATTEPSATTEPPATTAPPVTTAPPATTAPSASTGNGKNTKKATVPPAANEDGSGATEPQPTEEEPQPTVAEPQPQAANQQTAVEAVEGSPWSLIAVISGALLALVLLVLLLLLIRKNRKET